jgi:EAL domain-containing protein (putative c-di-GMP-specific phosphodiesterase class I)
MDTLIRPAFQPVMNAFGEIVLYEALMRFREAPDKPESRHSPIGRWEESGYIATVDVAVLKQVLAALKLLPRSFLVSVNVSPVTLNRHCDRYLRHLCSVSDRASRLVVEITDSATPTEPAVLLKFAQQCAEIGVHVAFDDCVPDTPRCAESVLRTVRPRLVKLDRDALSAAFQARNGAALRTLSAMADSIGARAVAQGIDTQEKLDWAAQSLGVRYFQGVLVGHPRHFPLLDTMNVLVDPQHSQPPAQPYVA